MPGTFSHEVPRKFCVPMPSRRNITPSGDRPQTEYLLNKQTTTVGARLNEDIVVRNVPDGHVTRLDAVDARPHGANRQLTSNALSEVNETIASDGPHAAAIGRRKYL